MARPKSDDPKLSVPLRLRASLVTEVDAAAERRGWTRRDFITRAVERAIEGERQMAEA